MFRLSLIVHRAVVRVLAIVATLFVCVGTSPSAWAEELTVSAAASLTDAFREIGKAFEAGKPGTRIIFNFGASGPLLQQIAQGAPVDVFASADQETKDRAAAKALIVADSRMVFANNQLVLAIPAGAALVPIFLNDLTASGYRRIAIGSPASVPAGRYAREATDAAGLTEALQDRFIYADSVRQVLAYVARAEVDAGFVYRTDALIDKERVKIALELPTRTPVSYPVAQVATTKRPALSREFIAYLRTAPAQAVLTRFGFRKP
ncbi:MAG: molybdate ABC transporter substrate-binding protein [Betaproteobacteria bacterium]|nr:molybdate ABC transporter substrate-binding protein [Betaproteobacteria bacterium]